MTAFEDIRDTIRAAFYGRIEAPILSEIESVVCLALGKYEIRERETSVVVYDGNDMQIIQKFFLSKAIQGCTKATIKTYGDFLKMAFREIGKHVTDITTDDVRLYLAQKKVNRVSDAYLATIHRILSSFFSWCLVEDIISRNPMIKVEKIKVRRKLEAALTDEEMERLRYACRTVRERALVEFIYSTGCRISEVCSLNITDVDFDSLEIIVLGKGQKYRTVYMTQRARFALRAYLDSRSDDNPALFVCDFDRMIGGLKDYQKNNFGVIRITPNSSRSLIHSIGKRAQLKLHPHLLRKTVATQALRRGMPIDQVKVMLGHEDISTTQIYANTDNVQVKQSHEKYV